MGRHFISGNKISFDTETTGLYHWTGDRPFAYSFCNENFETAYFEMDVDPFTRQPIYDQQVVDMIGAILEDEDVTKVMHNGPFDTRMVDLAHGIKIAGPVEETMFKAFNCNTLEPKLGLKPLGKKYGEIDDDDQDLLHKTTVKVRNRAKKLGWNLAFQEQAQPHGPPKRKAAVAADYWMCRTMTRLHLGLIPEDWGRYCEIYAVRDAERTMLLNEFYDQLIEEYGLHDIMKLEMDLMPVIYSMVTRGVSTNRAELHVKMKEAVAEMDRIYPRIRDATWEGFRPKKDEDVRKFFYENLGFEVAKWTKGGKDGTKRKPAVDKFVILAHIDNPVVKDIAVWKANSTAFTTFFAKFDRLSIPDRFGGETALHCDYRQIGPATGRLSSATPNLQNVMTPENTMAVHPIHVRTAFRPRPGYCWLCTDYEGMEIRMFAAISQESFMMDAIRAGRSIHDEMTNKIWGGEGNEEALKQAVRVLSLDGTGMHSSKEVDALWKEWGIWDDDIPKMTVQDQYAFADYWLSQHDYNQVKAQAAINRKNSKTTIKSLSFLKIYGGGPAKASLLLKCTKAEAKRTLDLYDTLFPGVTEYFNYIMGLGKAQGYITSMWGRRLAIDPRWAYRACNYMVQGSSADLMKRSMVRIHNWLRSNHIDAFVLMTIHDEIVIEVARHQLTKPFIRQICNFMSDTEGHLPIEMTVEPKVVLHDWSKKHKVEY
jgi:DNA polymerase I-like protein with 3'-5' exonuclease and polymerase domains